MKAKILVGVMAVGVWGGSARAEEPVSDRPEQQPVTQQKLDMSKLYASNDSKSDDDDAYGGAGDADAPTNVNTEVPSTTVIVNDDAPAVAATPVVVETEEKKMGDMKGLTLLVGGGVEGYSGGLAPNINPGVSWGVTAALKPTELLGLELSYSGAANDVSAGGGQNLTSGADIIRNGAEAVATVGLSPTSVQPYILGGIGVNRYNIRAGNGSAGFNDDTSGSVPLGAGIRTHIGDFTADARVNYNVLFENGLLDGIENTEVLGNDNFSTGGRYNGMIRVGTTF